MQNDDEVQFIRHLNFELKLVCNFNYYVTYGGSDFTIQIVFLPRIVPIPTAKGKCGILNMLSLADTCF
jgi:hypothetical protein